MGASCSAHTVPVGCRDSLPAQTSAAESQSLWDTADNLEISGRDTHTLSSCSEWTEEALSVQRKVLYLPPLPHFAYEMIFLLVHSEGVGFRYLFQLWSLSEVNACVKKRTLCVQSSRDSTTIVLSLFGFFPDSNVTLGRTPELGQRPGRTSIRI